MVKKVKGKQWEHKTDKVQFQNLKLVNWIRRTETDLRRCWGWIHSLAVRTEPFLDGYPGQGRVKALQVVTQITAITQQQPVLSVTPTTHLSVAVISSCTHTVIHSHKITEYNSQIMNTKIRKIKICWFWDKIYLEISHFFYKLKDLLSLRNIIMSEWCRW